MNSIYFRSFACWLALAALGSARAEEWEELARRLEAVSGSLGHAYRLHDDGGRSMDCLEIFQVGADGKQGAYGLYHTQNGGVFSVHLAHSSDLMKWRHVAVLDDHASQATICATADGGYLLSYEKDAPNSCWIRIRYCKDLGQLRAGAFAREFDVPRSLAPTAEGTPSIESVKCEGGDLSRSEIALRFHYFKDVRVDQLARGVLSGFKSWKAEPDTKINRELRSRGWRGNLGDRTRFEWRSEPYYLQEVQRRRGDWKSWGVYLCDGDGMPLRALDLVTHAKAGAFCNPNARWFIDPEGSRKLAVTMFLPGEGSAPSESGQLLYIIDPDG